MFEALYTVLIAVCTGLYGYCWGRDDGHAEGFETGYAKGASDTGNTTKDETA